MRVHFKVNYKTKWGEQVVVCGGCANLGNWDIKRALKLSWKNDGDWVGSIDLEPNTKFEYKYVVFSQQHAPQWEQGESRHGHVEDTPIFYHDTWNNHQIDKFEIIWSSVAFSKVIFPQDTLPSPSQPISNMTNLQIQPFEQTLSVLVDFKIQVSHVDPSLFVCVLGSSETLGNWLPYKAVRLNQSPTSPSQWELTLPIHAKEIPFEYKYLLVDSTKTEIRWETGANRIFEITPTELFIPHHIKNDLNLRQATLFRGTGVAIPLFSIRTRASYGIGDFGDLKKLIDWAAQTGMHLIQLLPVNDTRVLGDWRDSYPYSSLSVFALHPIYADLNNLGEMSRGLEEELERKKEREFLESLDSVDYEKVLEAKMTILKEAFGEKKKYFNFSEIFYSGTKKENEKNLEAEEIRGFVENNEWVQGYALFCYFKDKFETSNYNLWPTQFRKITSDQITQIATNPNLDFNNVSNFSELENEKNELWQELSFTYWLQYHLSKQLSSATDYAKSKKIVIKGDLPIGVDPSSADVWIHPYLFKLDTQTGAPPDPFSAEGQNWGFPTYNWDEMAKDNYLWWRDRLKVMSKYFHAYRIDHVLGFFRIWEIPANSVRGILGRLIPSIPIFKWELENCGVWDFDRLIEPYLTTQIIKDWFGDLADLVRKNFFDDEDGDKLKFKEFCNSQKKIQNFYETNKNNDLDEKIMAEEVKEKLFKLLENVILLKDKDHDDWFYPRIFMKDTESFRHLGNEHLMNKLNELYEDYYFKRQDEEWKNSAIKKLTVMQKASDMMVCVEDLGMLSPAVEWVLEELCLLGLRVQRMPSEFGVEFGDTKKFEYRSVCIPSTHDTSSLRGWWEEDHESIQRFYNNILEEKGDAPMKMTTGIARKILSLHLQSDSMWAIFLIQDYFAMWESLKIEDVKQERINEPANRYHYWRYRIQIPVEDLMQNEKDFGDFVRSLIRSSGRSVNKIM